MRQPLRYVILVGIAAVISVAFLIALAGSVQTTAILVFAGTALIQLVNLYKTVQTQQQTNGELEGRIERVVRRVLEELGIGRSNQD